MFERDWSEPAWKIVHPRRIAKQKINRQYEIAESFHMADNLEKDEYEDEKGGFYALYSHGKRYSIYYWEKDANGNVI